MPRSSSEVRLGPLSVGGPGRPALFAAVCVPTLDSALALARSARGSRANAVELRLDPLIAAGALSNEASIAEAVVAVANACAPLPLIATIRSVREGGAFGGDCHEYATAVRTCIRTGVLAGIDLEASTPFDVLNTLVDEARSFGVAVILSRHELSPGQDSPAVLAVLEDLAACLGSAPGIVKYAVACESSADSLALLQATQAFSTNVARTHPFITVAMGAAGKAGRIAACAFGSDACFAAVGPPSAPGQLSTEFMATILDALSA